MNHAPFYREGTGKNAVLFLHGIAGSPAHFRDLFPVVPEEFAVYSILLDGHGGTVADFSHSSMEKWKDQADNTLKMLFARYDQVVIVAHSMGTLFAVQAALHHPDRIPRLFLLNVPTRPWVRPSTWYTCLRVAFGKLDRPSDLAMRGETAIELTPRLWQYIGWAPRMLELLRECSRVRKLLPELTVKTLCFQSRKDELVSIRSCQDLARQPHITTVVLETSGHFVYSREDTAYLQKKLQELLQEI